MLVSPTRNCGLGVLTNARTKCESSQWNIGFKPIFEHNANSFALGPSVGLDPQTSCSRPPTQADTNMLVSENPRRLNANLCESNATPNESQSSCWVCEGLICVGHVDFMLFVTICSRILEEYGLLKPARDTM